MDLVNLYLYHVGVPTSISHGLQGSDCGFIGSSNDVCQLKSVFHLAYSMDSDRAIMITICINVESIQKKGIHTYNKNR